MHYFQFNIADYRSATTHLSNDEDLAYRRLLDMYYDTEQKIPLDTQWVARRLRVGTEVVEAVFNYGLKAPPYPHSPLHCALQAAARTWS